MAAIPVLRCTPDVRFAVIAPGGFRILAALDGAAKALARDLTLTAGTNDHTEGPHIRGEAFDVRVKDLVTADIVRLHSYLERTLGYRFTVLYECPSPPVDPVLQAIAYVNLDATAPHIHTQIRKGTVYPPPDLPAGQPA